MLVTQPTTAEIPGTYRLAVTNVWKDIARKLGRLATRRAPRVLRQAPERRNPDALGRKDRSTPVPAGRHLVYAPQLDGRADPGEIVWTWVPYEDEPDQGKDRPVLVVGRGNGAQDKGTLLGLMLSSQSERDGQRHWYPLGSGAWDKQARPSWIRLDRVLEVPEDGIRREGAVLDRDRFGEVAQVLRSRYGWDSS
jgi:PemK-like, MazF-like toxin of type II toxin-antitoxin system